MLKSMTTKWKAKRPDYANRMSNTEEIDIHVEYKIHPNYISIERRMPV